MVRKTSFSALIASALLGSSLVACSSSDGGTAIGSFDASLDGFAKDSSLDGSSSKDSGSLLGDASIKDGAKDAPSGDANGDVKKEGCGDGIVQPSLDEVCDDGNSAGGDGCAANCKATEKDWNCPPLGGKCSYTVACGDGKVAGAEQCDDGDVDAQDGCSSKCELEPGWSCPTPGAPCAAKVCGDGIKAGHEQCDDGAGAPGDGCSAKCTEEPGWACKTEAGKKSVCHKTVCGDGMKEGDEPCDKGAQNAIGSGCNPFCEVEPSCPSGTGACKSVCGDAMILPGDTEQCDDGNTKDGDGCSKSCVKETGWKCTNAKTQQGDKLQVPVTFRDVISIPVGTALRHPDFEHFGGGGTKGMVKKLLGADRKPQYTGICEEGNLVGPCPHGAQTTSAAAFAQWYNNTAGVNIPLVKKIDLVRSNGVYYFPQPPPSAEQLFPFDGIGWVGQGKESASDNHNFGFTTELRYWFEYKGNEKLDFAGDDDVWVFVNGQLVIDLGGLHGLLADSVTLDAAAAAALGLEAGKLYETVLFHAERHTNASNFNLSLTGFSSAKTSCQTDCGDGMVAGDEVCDNGTEKNKGQYGGCKQDCTRGPFCGDKIKTSPPEECDDGVNLTTYSTSGSPGCAPGCKLSPYCGDGVVNGAFQEKCDDGKANNTGAYGKCNANCTLGPRCGDGVVQDKNGEECDDNNTVSGDGCSQACKSEGPK